MKNHLLLKSFNYLDEASRLNVFQVMGWPAENYLKRKETMIKQRENMKKMKEEQEAKEKKESEGGAENDGEEAKCEATDSAPVAQEEGGGEEKKNLKTEEKASVDDLTNLTQLALSVNVAWDDAKEKDDGEKKEAPEAKANEEDDGDESKKENEPPVTPEEEVLPPLFGRVDPDTLLDRLNTRRLYSRILYYARKNRRKLEETAQQISEGSTGEDLTAPMPVGQGGIKEMYQMELKEKRTADRAWPKNMTIQEMADKEWDELVEMAEVRLNGGEEPWFPIPTQHELLLFSPCPRAVGILASYPRSGNSLMRTLYEHTTLRVTGSDMQGGLAKHDLVGEMSVGTNMVQFVKTHYPERQGTPPFNAARVVLLVRNPFDAIESYFNLMMTGTHTNTVTPEVREKMAAYWEDYVLKEIRVWTAFHAFWMNQDVPILLIRYEDLIRKTDGVMARVLQFVLEVKQMGTFFTERIHRCISDQEEIERLGSYKPRSGGIGKSLSKYSSKLLEKLKADKQLRNVMMHLGYKDLFDTPSAEWATKLEPLEDYATEYLPSWEGTNNRKVVVLNRGKLARGPDEQTHWQKIKKELGIIGDSCNCAKCVTERAKAVGAKENIEEQNSAAEKGSGAATSTATKGEAVSVGEAQ